MIRVQINTPEFERELRRRFGRKKMDRLITDGVNELAGFGERWIIKRLQGRTRLSRAAIEEHVYFRERAGGSSRTATFAISPTRRLSLRHLKARQTGAGVEHADPMRGGRRLRKSAWLARGGGKLPAGTGWQRRGPERLPIRGVHGPPLGLTRGEANDLHTALTAEWDRKVRRWMKKRV